MNYDYFIGMIRKFETSRIKAYRGKSNTTVERVPDAFGLLVPDIIKVMQRNIGALCNANEGIIIFGLQPASVMLTSNEPLVLERYLQDYQPDCHFCCTLEYLVVPLDQIDNTTNWNHTYSIVIDFTSGNIMDIEQYMSRMATQPDKGTIFGKINAYSLSIAWTIVKIKEGELGTSNNPAWRKDYQTTLAKQTDAKHEAA